MNKNDSSEVEMETKKYTHLALGGTFDHFHRGHREFLSEGFRFARFVTIGVTGDGFARKLHESPNLEPFDLRKRHVEAFLKEHSLTGRGATVRLDDPYGPTISGRFEALLVTARTAKNAQEINRQRLASGVSTLKLIRFPLVKAADRKAISSQRIRDGAISREGVVYIQELLRGTPMSLPDEMRSVFRDPFGTVHHASERNIYESMKKVLTKEGKKGGNRIICVGDLVTHSFAYLGKLPWVSIVDFMIRRRKRFSSVGDIGPFSETSSQTVVNRAGMITKKLVRTIDQALRNDRHSLLIVKGEEDLAVLPCVLLAPLGSLVLYGHFRFGIIAVDVTEEKKTESLKLLQQLERLNKD